jgi:hypothetical protein
MPLTQAGSDLCWQALAELLEKSMKPFSKASKSEKARPEQGARPLPQKVQKIVARANYESPKVICYPTDRMNKITPVTMMANL